MARYRKVEVKTWKDDKFRSLSPIQPCGQALWLWFLTGPRTTNIPGVLVGTDEVMAAELRWPIEAFRKAFREAFAKGMAKGDFEAGLVFLPNACKPGEDRNKPESPNVIRSWRDTWDELPDCPLKLVIWEQLKAFTKAFGEGFEKAFKEACRQPSPNQEQEQEQEQEQDAPEISSGPDSSVAESLSLSAPPNGRDVHRADRAPKPRPAKFMPSTYDPEPLRAWAAKEFPDVNFDAEISKLRDHEFKDAKSDWERTTRRWMRKAHEDRLAGRTAAAHARAPEPRRVQMFPKS